MTNERPASALLNVQGRQRILIDTALVERYIRSELYIDRMFW